MKMSKRAKFLIGGAAAVGLAAPSGVGFAFDLGDFGGDVNLLADGVAPATDLVSGTKVQTVQDTDSMPGADTAPAAEAGGDVTDNQPAAPEATPEADSLNEGGVAETDAGGGVAPQADGLTQDEPGAGNPGNDTGTQGEDSGNEPADPPAGDGNNDGTTPPVGDGDDGDGIDDDGPDDTTGGQPGAGNTDPDPASPTDPEGNSDGGQGGSDDLGAAMPSNTDAPDEVTEDADSGSVDSQPTAQDDAVEVEGDVTPAPVKQAEPKAVAATPAHEVRELPTTGVSVMSLMAIAGAAAAAAGAAGVAAHRKAGAVA